MNLIDIHILDQEILKLINKNRIKNKIKMKFVTLIAAIATIHAQDEAEAEVLETGAACGGDVAGTCPETDCCGTASLEGEESKSVCGASDATTWLDEDDDEKEYAFACAAAAEETGASKLVLSAAAFLAASYVLA